MSNLIRHSGYQAQSRVSLYDKEAESPVTFVGAGAGLDHPAIARVPLSAQEVAALAEEPESVTQADEAPLTIPEAKRRLALSLNRKSKLRSAVERRKWAKFCIVLTDALEIVTCNGSYTATIFGKFADRKGSVADRTRSKFIVERASIKRPFS